MAAVSAPQAPSALTPPTSSHDAQNSWSYAVPSHTENPLPSKSNDTGKPPLSHTNGNSLNHPSARPDMSQKRADTFGRSTDSGNLAPPRINALTRKDSSISETGSAPDSLLDLYGTSRSGISSVDYGERKGISGESYDEEDPENSRWIHRDKLARIESQELQAAGIILPRTRAASKSSKRENSRDHGLNGFKTEQSGPKRQRTDTITAIEQEAEALSGWDLRLPEEVAEDPNVYRDVSGGVKGVSKIPILKASPLPIPIEHLERDTPLRRKQSSGIMGDEEPISYGKSRGRSHSIKALDDPIQTTTPAKRLASDNSPTKKTAGARKGTSVSTNRAASAPQKSKPRSTGSRDTSSGQRPPTRSGELGPSNSVKRPEGDPPWLASMYKPDPRLPPDQQLLPTVAKRLQQEQWEKEGKFGNVYDTSFRPLNDEEFPQPAITTQTIEVEKKSEEKPAEWPLRSPKSPTLSTGRPGTAGTPVRTESYSTMPKLTGIPQGGGPLPSPKPPIRLQQPPEESKKGGCGCCVVM
ncbi:hypothetical protein G7Y89_g3213 [Cudoniella acicularis]|uniref:TeaA receptor TeaR n=1 Tax=Cudoniella acicularis TaxID=354080 RepID=A0A8H4W5E1_9HELO|nr:hypothetical protein G7Y89_g3213 [Cudoniella acicularis]